MYDFSLLKENLSQMNPENCKFGRKVVELFEKQFAKMAVTTHRHADIYEHLGRFLLLLGQADSRLQNAGSTCYPNNFFQALQKQSLNEIVRS